MNDYTGHHQPTLVPAGDYVTHKAHGVRFEDVSAEQILDSRGYPTIRATIRLVDGLTLQASAPAGASTGVYEAVELRDDDFAHYGGRGVQHALAGIRSEVAPMLTGRVWESLREVDDAIRDLDGTGNLSRLGANAVIAVSMAAARAFAAAHGQALHEWIAQTTRSTEVLPVPHFNVLNGGAHAANDLAFQEFMIAPVGAANEAEAIETGAAVYHALATLVRFKYGAVGLGDEGGFAPPISHPTEALDLLVEAITTAGFTPGVNDVAIAMDPAANGFYDGTTYTIAGDRYDSSQLADFYVDLLVRYPIRSIEDGFAEDDHAGWQLLFDKAADRVQLVGDDLYVTDPARIQDGADNEYSNAALIKPNQIGTVTQTFDAIATARRNGMDCMISHRSGETEDTFIADLAVGSGVGQIKSGAPARGERVVKYNRLAKIESHDQTLRYGLR